MSRPVRALLLSAVVAAIKIALLGLLAVLHHSYLNVALGDWDAKYYMGIAEGGYFAPTQPVIEGPAYQTSLAFFPLLPALLALLRLITFGLVPTLVLGVLLSLLCSWLAAWAVMELAHPRFDETGAALLILGAPMAITLVMPYSEALFMALALWALVWMVRRQWLWATLACLVAGLVRLTALDLIVVLCVAAFVSRRGAQRQSPWWVLLSPLGMVGYLSWAQYMLRDVGGYFAIQRNGWHSYFDGGRATAKFLVRALTSDHDFGYIFSAFMIIAYLVALAYTWPRLRNELWPVWLFVAAVCANVLLSDGIMHSRPRLLLPAIIMLLPYAGAFRRYAVPWVLVSAWCSAYMLVVFEWAI